MEIRASGDRAESPFVGSLRPNRPTGTLSRHTLRRRFKTACQGLDLARLETLTIHHGRHQFISHGLAGGRTLAEVRDAAGHANVSITSAYLHVAVEDQGVGELFGGLTRGCLVIERGLSPIGFSRTSFRSRPARNKTTRIRRAVRQWSLLQPLIHLSWLEQMPSWTFRTLQSDVSRRHLPPSEPRFDHLRPRSSSALSFGP